MKNLRRFIQKCVDKNFGTFYWKYRDVFCGSKWIENYISKSSIEHPHRQLLIDIISKYAPFRNVLEIGCASGPNLYLLSKKFPSVKLYGVDINKKAIKRGQSWFQSKNIQTVSLLHLKTDKLRLFSTKSIDIVFTDAVIIYIPPPKLKTIIEEMFRIARKCVILNEWHSDKITKGCFNYDGHWIYNYKKLLKNFPPRNIKITKIPPEIWGGNWAKYGYIIEVNLD